MTKMQAAWYERTGAAERVLVVGTLPRPQPGPGEVLVRLRASGVNPADVKKRAGWQGLTMSQPRVVPHSDGAGEVMEAGPGVPHTRLGDRVWLWNAQAGSDRRGTAAEYVAVPSRHAPRLPDRASWAEGACLGVPACTAHYAVNAGGLDRRETILVAGGAGAVGHFAIQFAKEANVPVITTVSSVEKAEHARRAGADYVIDYTRENVAARVEEVTEGSGVGRVVEVDLGANLATDADVIRLNGVIASYSSSSEPAPVLPYYDLAFKGVTIRLIQAYHMPDKDRGRTVTAICDALREGRLDATVARRLPLSEIAKAHRLVEEGGVVGTVVVVPGE